MTTAARVQRARVKAAPVRKVSSGRRRKVPPKNLAICTRQLSVMVDAGLPLVQCLEMLGKEEPDARLAAALKQVQKDVEAGAALAEAMEKQPHAFNALFTHMIAAGEAGGILDIILKRLSTYIEKQVKLESQVKSAMIYPAAVLTIAGLVVTGLLWKVIPIFADLFTGLNAQLPWMTRMVIAASHGFISSLPFLFAGAIGASFLFRRFYATPQGRLRVDSALLRLPVIGGILRKVAVARFCRTLSTLLSSGVPILSALDITGKTSGNALVETAVKQARGRIERGETIAAPLRATGVFPPMVSQMIGAGETTGALDVMLGKIAEFYEEEVETAVAGLVAIIEPIMITVLGIIVGIVVISMYLPLFELINQLS